MGLPVGGGPIGDGDGIVRLGCAGHHLFCAVIVVQPKGGRVENAEEYLK
jgi:hypothetical protein